MDPEHGLLALVEIELEELIVEVDADDALRQVARRTRLELDGQVRGEGGEVEGERPAGDELAGDGGGRGGGSGGGASACRRVSMM